MISLRNILLISSGLLILASPAIAKAIKIQDIVTAMVDFTLLSLLGHVFYRLVPNIAALSIMAFFYWRLTEDHLWGKNFALIIIWLMALKVSGNEDIEDFFSNFYKLSTWNIFASLRINLILYVAVILFLVKNYKAILNTVERKLSR